MVNLAEFNKIGSGTVAFSQKPTVLFRSREHRGFQPATEHFPRQEAPLTAGREGF